MCHERIRLGALGWRDSAKAQGTPVESRFCQFFRLAEALLTSLSVELKISGSPGKTRFNDES